jgi:hypothetical protein
LQEDFLGFGWWCNNDTINTIFDVVCTADEIYSISPVVTEGHYKTPLNPYVQLELGQRVAHLLAPIHDAEQLFAVLHPLLICDRKTPYGDDEPDYVLTYHEKRIVAIVIKYYYLLRYLYTKESVGPASNWVYFIIRLLNNNFDEGLKLQGMYDPHGDYSDRTFRFNESPTVGWSAPDGAVEKNKYLYRINLLVSPFEDNPKFDESICRQVPGVRFEEKASNQFVTTA